MARRIDAGPRRSSALDGLVRAGDGVLVLGLEDLADDAWAVLVASGLDVLRVADTAAAIREVAGGAAQIVVTDARLASGLLGVVRTGTAAGSVTWAT